MDLTRFPRSRLLPGPTPIEKLDRLTRHLGARLNGVNLYVKRDDLGPVGLGGNKLRKLEFLLGAALAEGADTVITVGALQSNHARLTAAAAARCGLTCELILTRTVPREDPDYTGNGNRLLLPLFGAVVHELPKSADSLACAEERAAQLRAQGRGVYVFPSGGSSPVGCLGYVTCADEIVAQSSRLDIDFARVVMANGSSGTHAGFAAGFATMGRDPRLALSYTVLAPVEEARSITLAKAQQTLALIGSEHRLSGSEILVEAGARGPGYGIPTDEMREALRVLARTEGLLLDPVYSGKAFAGLLADVAAGAYRPGQNLLFVMTGGVPGLFAYASEFRGTEQGQGE